jgi:hypothetical protein
LPKHIHALHVGQAQIQYGRIVVFGASEIETGLAVGGGFDDEAVAAQPIAQAPRQIGVVLDKQNTDSVLLPN